MHAHVRPLIGQGKVASDIPRLANVPSDGLVGVAIGGEIRLAWSRYAAFTVADTQTFQGGDQ